MKKLFFLLSFVLLLVGCNGDDINDLNNKYNQLSKEQQELLEEQNRQADLLRNYETLLNALQSKLTVSDVEDTSNGYKIVFSDGSEIQLTNGHTPVFSLGDNGNWYVDGEDSGVKASGTDGQTPDIEIVDGYWHIDGQNTDVKAEGVDGSNGESSPAITGIIIQGSNMVFNFSNDTHIVVPMGQNASADYSHGFFIINEGWFGHEQGSVNFYRYGTNQIETGLFPTASSDEKALGVTTQYAAIYNGKLYLISKQGALVAVDSKTMQEIGRIDNFNTVAKDGRAFCGVNANLGLVSTADGIYKLNLNPLSVGDKIEGISGQVGELLQYRQHVFAVMAGKIHAINTSTWAIDKTFDNGRGGLTVSKDGMVWSSNGNVLLKINPLTLEMETVTMPSGVSVTYNSMAWTASSLSASKQENALFFRNGLNVYKYIIGDITSLNTPLFTVPSGRMAYGAGIGVDPKNNQVIFSSIDGYGTSAARNNLYFYDGTTGSLKKDIFYEHYWFPAMIVFPED